MTPDIYTRPDVRTLSHGCRKKSTNRRLITTTARLHSLSSVAHFPRDTRYFGRNVGKHWIDCSILKSGVDTYEDQLLRVMIEAYRLALR